MLRYYGWWHYDAPNAVFADGHVKSNKAQRNKNIGPFTADDLHGVKRHTNFLVYKYCQTCKDY